MGTNLNSKNFVSGSKPAGSLVRQSSIYSLTFDEFQSTLVKSGKEFGSMNMDELLKNIWTAEETQAISSSAINTGQAGGMSGSNLHRQGSLALPRTLSQKTVDEVWRDLLTKETNSGGGVELNAPQGQQTLGEMTLEEFLVRAGVVRDGSNDNNTQQIGIPNHCTVFLGNNKPGLGLNQAQNTGLFGNNNNAGAMGQAVFPKQANVAFGSAVNLAGNNLIGVFGDNSVNKNLAGLGTGTVRVGSPGASSADLSSLSPVPCVFGSGQRGGAVALEKVIERRRRRMIKNRESAARSRARKQAYTLELEAEIAKLKETNQDLRRKQAEMMEMQKNQLKEPMNRPSVSARRCLKRTITGPW